MNSATSLHFGPEWMRKPKPAPVSPGPNGNTSNPLSTASNSNYGPGPVNGTPTSTNSSNTGQTPSSYSSLLASPMQPQEPVSDSTNPFRYSKEQMLAVWKNGGGHGELGLEVERWPGIVTEEAGEPLGLTDLSPEEKKLYAMPYNSDPPALRRRGDSYSAHTPLLGSGGGFDSARDRNKMNSPARYNVNGVLGSTGGTPTSVGLGLPGRRGKDGTSTDVPLYRPRQLSLGTGAGPASPVTATPTSSFPGTRPRLGSAQFDGVMGDAWGACARRRVSEPRVPTLGAKDDKLDAPWRNGGDPRFKDEIMEEPVDDWEDGMVESGSLKQGADPMMGADATQHAHSLDPFPTTTSNGISGMEAVHPESVQWMYKDPTGQVQGPFGASVMQTWCSGGYFADDLLLQRVELDEDFDPLYNFRQRVIPPGTADTLFLSSISPKVPRLPPGLVGAHASAPPGHQQFPSGSSHLNSSSAAPPAIVTSLMDNSSYHSSPSASHVAFGALNTETPSATTTVRSTLSDLEKQKREREEFLRDLREKELAGQAQIAASEGPSDGASHVTMGGGVHPGVGGMGTSAPSSGFLSGQMGLQGSRNDAGYQNDFGIPQNHQLQGFGNSSSMTPLGQPSPFSSDRILGFNDGSLHNGNVLDQMYSSGPVHGHIQSGGWPGQQQQQGLSNHIGNFTPITPSTPSSNHNHSHIAAQPSPWYSIIEPTAANLPVDHQQHHHVNQFQHPNSHQETGPFIPSSAPWSQQAASQPVMSGAVMDQGHGFTPMQQQRQPSPLSNVHPVTSATLNIQPQETPVDVPVSNQSVSDILQSLNLGGDASLPSQSAPTQTLPDPPVVVVAPPKQGAAQKPTVTTSSQRDQQPASAKRRTAPTITTAPTSITIPETLAAATFAEQETPPISTPSSVRPVWSNFGGDEKPAVSTTVSLRQIQETEAKKAAEQKKAEREKAKAAASVAGTPSPQTVVPTSELTGSWGLPQVGRAVPVPASQSPAPGSTPLAAGNVWSTKPAQASKKSMKEIQEEEERQKRVAAQQAQIREAAPPPIVAPPAAPAKRGYADSAKPSSGAPVSTSAWATVGAGGKVVAGAASTPAPPTTPSTPVARTTGVASLPARPLTGNTAQSTSSTSASRATAQATSSSRSMEEVPTPSLEFIAWMRQALRGLTSANVEEVMSMLLSFPLDPPPSTMDLISDTIYEYSAILDGRRFATEYVAKRKADAANVKVNGIKPANPTTTGKSTLADVVRTQPPKPTESEWAYKVVTKKKAKGGRGQSNN
ncbi:hypothetical protein FRB93_011110 [Tulasnella sp. JGI-2019a]|nr:hypothetical protein FRB93_011110 [Tulasnella sp. JGI-2019a]